MRRILIAVTALAMLFVMAIPASAAKPVQGPDYIYPGIEVDVCSQDKAVFVSAFTYVPTYYKLVVNNDVLFEGVIEPYFMWANEYKKNNKVELTVSLPEFGTRTFTWWSRLC